MDHCTELLVTHEDGRRSCLDSACGSPDPIRHDWRVDCGVLGEPCPDCVPAVPERRQRAA